MITSVHVLLILVGIVVILMATVLVIAAYSAHTVVRPRRSWRPGDLVLPAEAPESVTFGNRAGLRLHGWYVPARARKSVVLVCHGFGTNRTEGWDVWPWLNEAGYGVLLFDFQAHGESEGRYTTVGLREVEDVVAAVEFVRQREGEEIVVLGLGFSMGASTLIAAAVQTTAIQALVLDSAFATLRRAVARSFRVFFRLPPRIFTHPTLWFAERMTKGRVSEVQPIDLISAVAPRPVLIIQGTEDSIVDPEDCLLLYEAAGEPKWLWRIEGIDHVQARSAYPEEYRRRVLELFDSVMSDEWAAARRWGRCDGRQTLGGR